MVSLQLNCTLSKWFSLGLMMLRPTALLVLPLGSTSIPPRSNSLCSTLCCSLIGYILIFSFLMVLIPDWFWSFGLAVLSARFHRSPFLALFMFLILTYMWQNWGSNDTADSKTINWVISNWISFLLSLQTQRWLFEDLKHSCPTCRTETDHHDQLGGFLFWWKLEFQLLHGFK